MKKRAFAHLKWGVLCCFLGILSQSLAHSSSISKHHPKSQIDSLNALRPLFVEASEEFLVPEKLLEGIAFAESHWVQRIPSDFDSTEASERPSAYGVMGLRSDEWFGRSLDEAALLIGKPKQDLILNASANIRGAAALLADLAREQNSKDSSGVDLIPLDKNTPGEKVLVKWAPVIALYSGIHDAAFGAHVVASPQEQSEAQVYVREVLKAAGDSSYLLFKDVASQEAGSVDYSGAVWNPSPNFDPAGNSQQFIVIHVTDGSFAGALSWLKNPAAKVSAHYLVRSSDGKVVQLVSEVNTAWHVRCWNPYTIGIEHEGFTSSGEDLTEELYAASAKLVANIASRRNIPVDRDHVIGHNFWQTPQFQNQTVLANCNDHVDPGVHWNWDRYFQMIKAVKP